MMRKFTFLLLTLAWAALSFAALSATPSLRADDSGSPATPAPKMAPTDLTCPRCHSPLVKNPANGVLHCTNPNCGATYYVDKNGNLQPLVSVVTPKQAAELLSVNQRTQMMSQMGVTSKQLTPEEQAKVKLNPSEVGKQFFDDQNIREAKPGEQWAPKGYDPNGPNVPKMDYKTVTSPIEDVKLKEPVTGNRNGADGIDRDFMRHSLGTFAVNSIVWLDPDSGYAALPEDFEKPVSDALREAVLKNLKPEMIQEMTHLLHTSGGDPNQGLTSTELQFDQYVDLNDVPDYLKYEHAFETQDLMKKVDPKYPGWDYAIRARVCTEASYACRDYLSGTIRNGALIRVPLLQRTVQFIRSQLETSPNMVDNIPAQYAQAEQMLAEYNNPNPNDPKRTHYEDYAFFKYYLMLNIAGLQDRMGEAMPAYKSLQAALMAVPSPANFQTAREKVLLVPVLKQFQDEVTLRETLLKREQEYIRQAALNGIVALYLGRYPKKDLPPQVYLVAEQMRRVGAYRRSLAWFHCAQRLNGVDGALTEWTSEQILLPEFDHLKVDDQDQALFDYMEKAYKAKGGDETVAAFPHPPTDFSLEPDAAVADDVQEPQSKPNAADAAVAGVRTIPMAMKQFYEALAAHRKLTGNLPGEPAEMIQKGTWDPRTCPELTFDGRNVYYGADRLAFVYDSGGGTGWGSDSCFLLEPGPDNDKAMYVLLGNGKVININPNAPAPKPATQPAPSAPAPTTPSAQPLPTPPGQPLPTPPAQPLPTPPAQPTPPDANQPLPMPPQK
ncbi:MAG: hypothetical protein ACREJ2_10150 [Planctomycetota bacterium]